jgi:adenine phosphoribosyltransferase
MTIEEVKSNIRDIVDFPIPGIVFKDLTTAFKNPDCMKFFEDEMYRLYKDKGITKVVGIESRGFIMAPVLGNKLGVGFVPIRKKGKLPADVIEISYGKEYGEDVIQIHADSLDENDVVLLHDDLLATGGTMAATHRLVQKCNPKQTFINFVIELEGLNGRKAFTENVEVETLLKL